ncbi:MAG: hypothetical protein KC503_20275, partial [Myxococcales bacterium]|nr:hypothetical protein [Myxococcales bacterium]
MAKRSRKKPPQWPRLVLSVDDGSGISLQRVFEQEQVVVGSVEGVDLRVEARGVAAYHAAIAAAEQGGVALRDLRGQPVLRNGVSCGHEIELHHGDRVAIGSATLVVGIGAAPNERSARDTLRGFQAAVPANRVPAAAPASKPAAGAVQKTQQAKAERAVAALLAESRKGARAVGEGRFRLDYSRALDKIKRFQLTDPHRYVLELVQAAVASGTLGVDIDMDADDMHMRFDKRYSGEELGRLFDHIFVSDPAHARISQLAVGVNAALALRPKFIIVESGDGKQGTRLRLSTHEDLDVQALSGAGVVDGTHIHVRERKSFQVLLDAIRGNAEERLLAEHCTRCPVPLRLQGKDLRRDLASDAICRLRFDDAASGRRIELVLPRAPAQRSRITLARNGVDIVQAEVQGGDAMLALGFVGHLDDPALALNASRSDVQRDNNYQKMLSELRRAARQLVIEALGGGAVQRLAPGRRRSWLREAAAYISAGKRGDRSGDPKIARAVDMLLDEPDLVELAYYQPNPDGTRGEIARGPLRAFVEAGEPIRQAPRRFTMTRDDIPAGPLHSVAFEPTPWLRHVFACRVEQAASYYIPLEQTAKNRAERLARRREATLSSARMLLARARIESETPPMVGEIGLDLVVGDEAEDKQGVEVTFLREGVPLDTHLVRDKHIHGVAVIDSPQFEPTAHWDGIKRNAAFRAVGKVIGNSTAALCEALCQTFAKLPPPAELATLMIWDASAGARSEPQRMGLLWGWPQDKTSRRAREVAERLLHKMPRLDAEQAPWLWRWPLFHTLEGRPIALEELEAARQQHRFVYFVGGVHWGETDLPVAGDAPVVNASDGQRRLLRKYFPEGTRSLAKALESRRAHLEQRAAIDAVRARNLVRARLRRGKPELSPHTCSEIMDLPAEGGVVGQIGLLRSPRVSTMSVFVPDSEAGDDAARAALPLLEEIPLDTPVPLQVAALAPDIEPDERFFGPQRGPALTRLLALARAQIEPLLCTLATRRGDALGPSERDVLWVYLADLATKTRRGHEPTLPEPIEQAPLLETLCHGSRALADARAEAEETGRLLVVDKATHPRTQLSERPIFVCAGDLRATLVRLVGAQTVDYSAQLIKEQAAIARSQAPRENPRIPPGHLAVVPVVGPDIIGDLALDEATAMNWKAASSAVRVLVDGRPIERRDVYLDGLPAKAVISSPRFTPDRFFTRVRDDEAWRDGERALRAAADRLVRLICERLLSDSTRGGRALQDIEREALASALQRVAADRFRGDPSVELDGASEADWALAHAPAWPLCPSGSYGGLVELARSMRESGELLYVRTADGHPAAGRVIARAPAEVTRRALLAIFGGSRLRVARETLERDEKAYQRREKAPEALRLSRGEVFAPAAIEWRGAGARAVDGELGLARDHLATPGIVVDCAVDGRQFGRWNVPAPLAAQATLDCRGLSADWADNIFRDADDGALLEQLLRDALWRAVAELARGARALTRWRPSDRAQRQHLILALASTIPMRDPPAGLLELLATAPLFESTAHQQLTAQQLLSRARNDDRLLVVSDLLSPGEPMDGRLIVRADEAGRAALEALAGERFERHDEIWKQELLGMERRQKALPSEPFLSGASAVRSQFSRGDISGVAGLLQPDLYGDSASRVRLNVGRRPVVVREPTWTPAIEVWINCDRLQPNRAFDDVTEDAVYAEVMAVAEAQRVDLVLRAAQSQSFRVSTALRDRLQLYVARAAADLARARDEQDDEAARLLLDTPIWRCIDESGPREVSTEALIAAAREQRLARVESIERRTPPRGGPLLFCTSAEITRAWNQQLGLALPDYSAKLDALEARRTFLERPQEKIDLAAQLGVGLFAR